MKESYIYILTNKTRTMLYIGVTSNLLNRVNKHVERTGSKFINKYNIKYLVYFEKFSDINQAIAQEKQLKNWHKEWKWNLVKETNPKLKDLLID